MEPDPTQAVNMLCLHATRRLPIAFVASFLFIAVAVALMAMQNDITTGFNFPMEHS